jgi:hypothetical protein
MHTKRNILITLVAIVLLSAGIAFTAHLFQKKSASLSAARTVNQSAEEQDVRTVVLAFGKKLQSVPLAGSKEIAAKAIQDTYAPFVSADLLADWEKDPPNAPGRLTASPWPDRIDIDSVAPDTDGSYTVQGKIIEITSAEIVNGGVADSYLVAMKLRKQNDKWVITGFIEAVPVT